MKFPARVYLRLPARAFLPRACVSVHDEPACQCVTSLPCSEPCLPNEPPCALPVKCACLPLHCEPSCAILRLPVIRLGLHDRAFLRLPVPV